MSLDETTPQPIDPKRLRAAFHDLIRRFGLLDPTRTPCGQSLPISHAHGLMALLHAPGTTQGQLAATLGLSKSAVSRMAAGLERRGWVERRKDATDGRLRRVSLTEQGRRVAERVDVASLERFSAMLARLPAPDRPGALATLDLLSGAIPVPAHEPADAEGTDR